jgi:hypothetical protein
MSIIFCTVVVRPLICNAIHGSSLSISTPPTSLPSTWRASTSLLLSCGCNNPSHSSTRLCSCDFCSATIFLELRFAREVTLPPRFGHNTLQQHLAPPDQHHRQGRRRSVRPGSKQASSSPTDQIVHFGSWPRFLRLESCDIQTRPGCHSIQISSVDRSLSEHGTAKQSASAAVPDAGTSL